MSVQARRIFDFDRVDDVLAGAEPVPRRGRVQRITGSMLVVDLPRLELGQHVSILRPRRELRGEVVGFEGRRALVMPFDQPGGVAAGMVVESQPRSDLVRVGEAFIGRTVDPFGEPLDGGPPIESGRRRPLQRIAPNPMARRPIDQAMPVGVRVIDGLCTLGAGQRVGIFAGSGVGKSTLLGMMARNAACDCVVIGLVGERGREVREFVERDLGPEGRARSAVVVATSDRSPLLRIRAAEYAVALAEDLRSQGKNVLFLMDSVTRYAHARREVGLAAGEPPATRGFPPSVFAAIPALMERLGNDDGAGSITALVTVLVEGDDLDEPISDTVRGVLDGHIVLSRPLAEQAVWPAVDPLVSLSRLARQVSDPKQIEQAAKLRFLLARYKEVEDMVRLGAYVAGSDPSVDFVLERREAIRMFLCQGIEEYSSVEDTWAAIELLLEGAP
jgi:FliI/YscN family ATPase